ncbi:MAG: RNA polymerase sigma factor [Candidatus Omnitrophota bacterium]
MEAKVNLDDIAPEVLERVCNGDMGAFEQIYKAFRSFVYNVALRITRNSADAEEVTQDVFMKIYRNLKRFEFRSSFRTWVYRIAMNTAINQYRRSRREEGGRVDYESVAGELASEHSTVEDLIEKDNEDRLKVLLERLNPKQKACLVLRELQGFSYAEIAATLKIPVNTVRTRLKRARQALLEGAGKGRMKDEM